MSDTDARLWHPWLRINRVMRVMHALERGGVESGQSRVQAGARAAERDRARGVVQLTVTSAVADITRFASYTAHP